ATVARAATKARPTSCSSGSPLIGYRHHGVLVDEVVGGHDQDEDVLVVGLLGLGGALLGEGVELLQEHPQGGAGHHGCTLELDLGFAHRSSPRIQTSWLGT